MSDNYILLSQRDDFYLFSRSGRFVSKIGSMGGGPGEYYTASFIHIDEKNKQVILKESYRKTFLYYDFKGRFIKSIPYEGEIGMAWINSYINNHIILKSPNFGYTPYTYTILDSELKIIKQQIRPVQFTLRPAHEQVFKGTLFCQYVYNNQMHVRENMLNDTLYMVNNDYSFVPKYIINAGKHEITVDIRSNAELFKREMLNLITVLDIYETNDCLLMSYAHEKTSHCYYNKSDNKLMYFSSLSGIPNDYDGGLDFWPNYQHNNQLITFYDAYQIKEHEDNSNKLKPKGSAEAINRFNQMRRKLDPEDNPVMVIVTLK
jgi:hypothetical protein